MTRYVAPSEMPYYSRLLRAWLAIPKAVFDEWRRRCTKGGKCWVCGMRRKTSPVHGRCRADHFAWDSPKPRGAEWRTLQYVRGVVKMGWKDARDDAAQHGAFLSLKKDKESVMFLPLTEPEPTEKPGFRSDDDARTVYRVLVVEAPVKSGAQVLNFDLTLYAFNAYAASIGEGHELKDVVKVTRRGKKGDTNTRYDFKVMRKAKPAEVKEAKRALTDVAVF